MDERKRNQGKGKKRGEKGGWRKRRERREGGKKTSASTLSPGAYSSQTKTRSGPMNLT